MALFLSTDTNKVDKKGRVLVPRNFRAALEGEEFNGVVIMPSLSGAKSLEGSGYSRFVSYAENLDAAHPFGEKREAFGQAVFGMARELGFDPEGRIALPPELLESAGITNLAVFVGMGRVFQVWSPERHDAYREEMLTMARNNAEEMPWSGAQVGQNK